MRPLYIHRSHTLGLVKAQEVAKSWTHQAEKKFQLECRWSAENTVQFKRAGVSGQLEIAENYFELKVQLGFLFQSFSGKIERAIHENLDALLNKKTT
jgi:putative polyhydroxyalkanoate system protein